MSVCVFQFFLFESMFPDLGLDWVFSLDYCSECNYRMCYKCGMCGHKSRYFMKEGVINVCTAVNMDI